MSPHLALSLDVAAGVVIAGAVFGAIWLGLSLVADSRATGTGLLLILAAAMTALWFVARNIVLPRAMLRSRLGDPLHRSQAVNPKSFRI